MGIKKIKYINNTRPKFNNGTDYWSTVGNPLGNGWNEWSMSPSLSSAPPQLPGLSGISGTNMDPYEAIIKPRMDQIVNPNSQLNQQKIANINTPGPTTAPKNKMTGLQAASIVGGVTGIAGGYIGQQSAVKSSDELLANAGNSFGSSMGIGYNVQNDVNAAEEEAAITASGISNTLSSTATGASAGAAFGPVGAVVGGAIGGIAGLIGLGTSKHKLRKRIENARIMAQRRNTYNMSGAMTTGLQQDYYSNNASNGILYANNGKDLKQPIYE